MRKALNNAEEVRGVLVHVVLCGELSRRISTSFKMEVPKTLSFPRLYCILFSALQLMAIQNKNMGKYERAIEKKLRAD